jgi:hypothetical protein
VASPRNVVGWAPLLHVRMRRVCLRMIILFWFVFPREHFKGYQIQRGCLFFLSFLKGGDIVLTSALLYMCGGAVTSTCFLILFIYFYSVAREQRVQYWKRVLVYFSRSEEAPSWPLLILHVHRRGRRECCFDFLCFYVLFSISSLPHVSEFREKSSFAFCVTSSTLIEKIIIVSFLLFVSSVCACLLLP